MFIPCLVYESSSSMNWMCLNVLLSISIIVVFDSWINCLSPNQPCDSIFISNQCHDVIILYIYILCALWANHAEKEWRWRLSVVQLLWTHLWRRRPGCPSIPCSISELNIDEALCNLGASVSVMPKSMFDKLRLSKPEPTSMCLELADHSVRYLEDWMEEKLKTRIEPMKLQDQQWWTQTIFTKSQDQKIEDCQHRESWKRKAKMLSTWSSTSRGKDRIFSYI